MPHVMGVLVLGRRTVSYVRNDISSITMATVNVCQLWRR